MISNKTICIFVIIVAFLPYSRIVAKDKAVVIAITQFCDFTDCEPAMIISLRNKVVANLLQHYNCTILSRSNPLALSTEFKLNEFDKINQDRGAINRLPRADYAITGYFKVARRTPGKNHSVDLGCTILLSDLNNKKRDDLIKREFIPDEATLYASDVTNEIVKALKLKKIKKEYEKQIDKIDETWAVLPIKRLESKKIMNKASDQELSINMELALQESRKLKNIVDHNEIDKVLKELKISALYNVTESATGTIAKLLGADKIIMGSVSKVHISKPDLRLDLFLVDGSATVIIDSASDISMPENINETISKLVLKFVDRKQNIPKLLEADKKRLKKEALLYEAIIWNMRSIRRNSRYIFLDEFAGLIYLLSQNDKDFLYKTVKMIVHYYSFYTPKNKKLNMIKLIDHLLKDMKESPRFPRVLYLKAIPRMKFHSTRAEAIPLFNRHLENNFDKKKSHINVVKGYISYCNEKLNSNKNIDFYKKQLEYEKKNNLRINQLSTYCKIDHRSLYNEEYELLLWSRENTFNQTGLIRLVQLTHILKGPKQALIVAKELSGVLVRSPEYQLELANIHFKLDDKESAAMILEGINRNKLIKSKWMKGILKKKQIKLFDDLSGKLKSIKSQWKRIADILKVKSNYTIYIQPIGTPDLTVIGKAIPLIEKNMGCDVKLLSKTWPMAEDKYVFENKSGAFQAIHLLERLERTTKIPDDAILLVYVTNKHLFTPHSSSVHFAELKGRRIVTYYKLYSNRKSELIKALAKNICTTIAPLLGNYCKISKCLLSYDDLGKIDISKKRFSICKECQKKMNFYTYKQIYKKFQKLNNSHILYNNSFRNSLWNDSPQYQEKYNKIINKINESN